MLACRENNPAPRARWHVMYVVCVLFGRKKEKESGICNANSYISSNAMHMLVFETSSTSREEFWPL